MGYRISTPLTAKYYVTSDEDSIWHKVKAATIKAAKRAASIRYGLSDMTRIRVGKVIIDNAYTLQIEPLAVKYGYEKWFDIPHK